MKTFFFDYALNVLIALVVLYFGGQLVAFAQTQYYTYAPIENFYRNVNFYAPDVCLGDKQQTLKSERFVNTEVEGYPSIVVRELFLVERGMQTKIFDEVAYPFIEKRDDGLVYRVQALPDGMDLGDYQWALHVTIKIGDVTRDDVSYITSNLFRVVECN